MAIKNLPFETASWARRTGALLIDWLVCTLFVITFVGWEDYWSPEGAEQFYTLGVYVLESTVLSALIGGSFGKVATRLRTVRVSGDPRPINAIGALARQIMVALVVPPLIFRPDGRGLHDMASGTATVTLQTWRQLSGKA